MYHIALFSYIENNDHFAILIHHDSKDVSHSYFLMSDELL